MKRLFPFLMLLVLLTTCFSACPPAPPKGPSGDNNAGNDTPKHDYASAKITLERTACFGTCPIYRLSIDGSGVVTYHGERFVATIGDQKAKISDADVQALVDAMLAADYFSLQDEYTSDITDMPTTITSLTIDGKTKQIRNYHGAPQKLIDLEKKIDATAQSDQWVKNAPDR